MVSSLPVVVWTDLSSASACSCAKVSARKLGIVQVSAPPSKLERRNSRRVFRFITLRELIFRCGHHQVNGMEQICLVQIANGIEKLAQRFFLGRFQRALNETLFQVSERFRFICTRLLRDD